MLWDSICPGWKLFAKLTKDFIEYNPDSWCFHMIWSIVSWLRVTCDSKTWKSRKNCFSHSKKKRCLHWKLQFHSSPSQNPHLETDLNYWQDIEYNLGNPFFRPWSSIQGLSQNNMCYPLPINIHNPFEIAFSTLLSTLPILQMVT